MNVTLELVDKIAHLAKLEFDPEEKESIRKDLEDMIGFVEKLNEVDTTGIPPLTHISGFMQALRLDEPGATTPSESVFRQASGHEDGFFTVPKVIRK